SQLKQTTQMIHCLMKRSILLPALLGFSCAASAAPQTFDFADPKGVNNATFTLDAPLETITGSATGISGTITIDRENPAETKGKIVIDATSLHVPNPVMKEHLHSADWMDSETHGTITFELKGLEDVKVDGDKAHATVLGTFTMKGVTKEVSVPVQATLLPGKLADRSNGQMQGDLLVLRSDFTLKRSDFGINPGAPTDKVADEVQIRLAIAGASPKE
ncbi:MAG: YceI family protein, partial [Verrucomicrobiia bacterium]